MINAPGRSFPSSQSNGKSLTAFTCAWREMYFRSGPSGRRFAKYGWTTVWVGRIVDRYARVTGSRNALKLSTGACGSLAKSRSIVTTLVSPGAFVIVTTLRPCKVTLNWAVTWASHSRQDRSALALEGLGNAVSCWVRPPVCAHLFRLDHLRSTVRRLHPCK